jgi:hypothetical protein
LALAMSADDDFGGPAASAAAGGAPRRATAPPRGSSVAAGRGRGGTPVRGRGGRRVASARGRGTAARAAVPPLDDEGQQEESDFAACWVCKKDDFVHSWIAGKALCWTCGPPVRGHHRCLAKLGHAKVTADKALFVSDVEKWAEDNAHIFREDLTAKAKAHT